MQGTKSPERFRSVKDYVERSGLLKYVVAKRWGVSTFQMSALMYPGRYPINLTDSLVAAIAADLNQPESYVRKLYPRAA